MNTDTPQKLKIGAFVIAGIILLIAGVFLIGSKRNMFSSTFQIYGTFKNAGGLQEGNNVRFGGVTVGTVKGVTILSDTVVRVDMIIQSDKREFIKSDAVASISSDGLMGDQLLIIAPGSPGAPVLKDGGKIPTAEPVDYGAIIQKFTNVASNAEVITQALADMSLQIEHGNGSIHRLLYRNDLALGLEGTMQNAQRITASMNNIAAHIQAGRGSLGSLIYTDNLSRSLDKTLATAQDAAYNFSENMRALQGNFFFRGYFRKREKARQDSLETAEERAEEQTDMTDEDLEEIKREAEKELQRRRARQGGGTAPAPGENKTSDR